MSNAGAYRADIDGLRAFAVLSVVCYHAFPSLLPGGFVGVDVFFVISGFLISGIIFKSLQEGDFSFSDFYARRVKRIFPALILVLAASFALAWFVLFNNELKQLGNHLLRASAFCPTLFFGMNRVISTTRLKPSPCYICGRWLLKSSSTLFGP
jgi:peptidoglycan/LPS O-acetylase OafA/YrhL